LFNTKDFLEKVISPGFIETQEYFKNIDVIAHSDVLLSELVKTIDFEVDRLNNKTIWRILSLIDSIFIGREVFIQELYPVLLRMMRNDYSCDASIPYKYVDLLLAIKKDKAEVFKDILQNTSKDNPTSVCISVLALYSPLGDFSDIPKELVEKFLDIVYKCYLENKNHEYLKKAILHELLPCIKENEYSKYYSKFVDEGISASE